MRKELLFLGIMIPIGSFPELEKGDYTLIRMSSMGSRFEDTVNLEQLADIVVLRDNNNISVVATVSTDKFTLIDSGITFRGVIRDGHVYGVYANDMHNGAFSLIRKKK